jgi:splicing factor 3A subunit 3
MYLSVLLQQKAKAHQQHKVDKLLEAMTNCTKELHKLYKDEDGILKEELTAMRGPQMFTNFYAAVNSTREYHQKFPNAIPNNPLQSITDVDVQFSGEEVFGKYLDLHQFFHQYCNIPNIPGVGADDYLQYLVKFYNPFFIPESCKQSKQYAAYLTDLYAYLADFLHRVQPLIEQEDLVSDWQREFEQKWKAGTVRGWKLLKTSSSAPGEGNALRLGMFNDVSELEALGGDRLKEALTALGLKCGGTTAERAHRLWSVRGVKPEDYPAKLVVKRKLNDENMNDTNNSIDNCGDWRKKVQGHVLTAVKRHCNIFTCALQAAWGEYKITSICEFMMDIVSATYKHAVLQQTRTAEEKEAEIEEEEVGQLPEVTQEADNKDDDDAPIYNPLNIPLGWDGKPIPFWLFKLHGLGNEYKCEICGNQSYWGRKAFDKHFQEWRHAHGMRCLGIPNTKHFHDITSIEDALTLYVKIKDTISADEFVGDVHEEFEDSEGNVLNRRTYEDLARQGLL